MWSGVPFGLPQTQAKPRPFSGGAPDCLATSLRERRKGPTVRPLCANLKCFCTYTYLHLAGSQQGMRIGTTLTNHPTGGFLWDPRLQSLQLLEVRDQRRHAVIPQPPRVHRGGHEAAAKPRLSDFSDEKGVNLWLKFWRPATRC